MNISPGKYFIICKKRCFWVHNGFDIIEILSIDEDYIEYRYEGDIHERRRAYWDFTEISLAPINALIRELI